MKTPASIHGHPIHPMLVTIPIGLWVFSFACDVIHAAGGNPTWAAMALYSMAGGIAGALLAAIPGAVDLFSLRHHPAGRVGVVHMTLNLTVVVIYIANFALRLGGDAPGPGLIATSAVALALLAVSGWLGGRMVYELGVGVAETSATARKAAERPVRAARET